MVGLARSRSGATGARDVRYWGHSGKHLLGLSLSGFDPKADMTQLPARLTILRQRLHNFARAFDENLRQRAKRPVLERDDADLPARRGQVHGQHFDRRRLAGKSHNGGGYNREKASGRRKPEPQAVGFSVDRRAGGSTPLGPKGSEPTSSR